MLLELVLLASEPGTKPIVKRTRVLESSSARGLRGARFFRGALFLKSGRFLRGACLLFVCSAIELEVGTLHLSSIVGGGENATRSLWLERRR